VSTFPFCNLLSTIRIFLSLLVAATAVLAFHQEQVNEPTVFEASRALSAEFKAAASAQDETTRDLTAAGRCRGGRGGRRGRGRHGGRRGRGRRGLVSVEDAQDEAEETTRELTDVVAVDVTVVVAAVDAQDEAEETVRELTAAGRRRGRRGGRRGRGRHGGRRGRGRHGGHRGRGRRGLVSVEEVQDETEETTRELTAAGRRRGGRRGGRRGRGRHGGRRGRGRRN
ncbi:unnamed protein product, partial [Aphanomyces euteiches]